MTSTLAFIGLPGTSEWIIILIGFAVMFYWIKNIIHAATHQFQTPNQKVIWLLVIVLLGVLGAFIYDITGRQNALRNN